MDGPSRFSISAQALYSLLGTALASVLIGVRADGAFDADEVVGLVPFPLLQPAWVSVK